MLEILLLSLSISECTMHDMVLLQHFIDTLALSGMLVSEKSLHHSWSLINISNYQHMLQTVAKAHFFFMKLKFNFMFPWSPLFHDLVCISSLCRCFKNKKHGSIFVETWWVSCIYTSSSSLWLYNAKTLGPYWRCLICGQRLVTQ